MQLLRCPACMNESASKDWDEFVGARGLLSWHRCPECNSYFFPQPYNPQKEASHTETRPWGQLKSGLELNRYKERMYLAVLDLLLKHQPPPGHLLDVGCSFGGFLMVARKAGYKIMGMDILMPAIEYLQAQGIQGQVADSIETLAAADGTFDVISCLDCNCYFSNQPRELRQVFRKLKPSGHLVMRVVDKSWMFTLGHRVQRINQWLGNRLLRASVNDHRFSMPVRSLLRLLQDAGFEIVYASPRGAIHSHDTRLPTKMAFSLGAFLWDMSGVFMAPGALVMARKPAREK